MSKITEIIRVRFAPSPTGFLHLGGARTALFNWLFAKQKKGVFVLRIEDTDELRSTPESIKAIIDGMRWLGMDWQEGAFLDSSGNMASIGSYGPYYQAQRLDIYKDYIQKLSDTGKAYKCFCTQAELDEMRKKASEKKENPKYDGRCRNLSPEESELKIKQGLKYVVRFKMPESGSVEMDDLIRGRVVFENSLLDDFVILKASGMPVYNFAVTVDDYLMKISHVIRGDDHLSNTPRQIHIYKAFGWVLPLFAHLPMILGPDGSRLSKRHGATAVEQYKQEGYLPEAVINYLALLGWSTSDSQQVFEPNELVEKFSLEHCSKSAAIFDMQKLLWLNGEYMKKLSSESLLELSKDYLTDDKFKKADPEYLNKLVLLEQSKYKLLSDIPKMIDYFIDDNYEYDAAAATKHLTSDAKNMLNSILGRFEKQDNFDAHSLEGLVRKFCDESGLKTAKVFHPLRYAVSGRTYGPGLFELLETLGRDKVVGRIKKTLSKIEVQHE